MAFYQKYRPKVFSDLVGEDHIKKTLIEAVKTGRLSHAYLLCGPRGTGKTSTARLLAKALNCEAINEAFDKGQESNGEPCNKCQSCQDIVSGRAPDVIEIDAASHTKVDEIRAVIDKAQFAPAKSKKKIYIIDEVHMLSTSSFNALLKTLEEPPKHVVFILATTEAHKLPATVLSRTQRYDFHRVSKKDIVENLKKVAQAEGITIDDEALDLLAASAEGGHRDALGLLEQISSVSKNISGADAIKILGIAGIEEITKLLGAIFNYNSEEGLKIAHRLYENGASMAQLNREIVESLRKILLIQISDQILFEETKEKIEAFKKMSQKADINRTLKIIEIFIKAGQLLKDIAYPILPIEMAIIEACAQECLVQESLVEEKRADKINSKVKEKPESKEVSKLVEAKKEEEEKRPEAKSEKTEETKESAKEDLAENEKDTVKEEVRAESVNIDVFQMTDDLWNRVIDVAKKDNPTLAALLRDAKPIEVSEGNVVLGVKFPFHKDKISEPQNSAFLEKIFSEITGSECRISCKINNEKRNKAKSEIKDEELQKAAEEIFS